MANSLLEYQTQLHILSIGGDLWCTQRKASEALRGIVSPEELLEWHTKEMESIKGCPNMEGAIIVSQEVIVCLKGAVEKGKVLEAWASNKGPSMSRCKVREVVNEALKDLRKAFQTFEVVDTDPILMRKRQAPRELILKYLRTVVRASLHLMVIACPGFEEWKTYVEEAILCAGLRDFNFDTPNMYQNQFFRVNQYNLICI